MGDSEPYISLIILPVGPTLFCNRLELFYTACDPIRDGFKGVRLLKRNIRDLTGRDGRVGYKLLYTTDSGYRRDRREYSLI
jgi:hypothetical protein